MVTKVYKSMQGKIVDMDALRANNETMPAIGNARMNARGDELGAGGKIIRKREESVAAYYENNPNAKGPVNSAHAVQPAPAEVPQVIQSAPQGKKK